MRNYLMSAGVKVMAGDGESVLEGPEGVLVEGEGPVGASSERPSAPGRSWSIPVGVESPVGNRPKGRAGGVGSPSSRLPTPGRNYLMSAGVEEIVVVGLGVLEVDECFVGGEGRDSSQELAGDAVTALPDSRFGYAVEELSA
jgi:hypothetical protein